MVKDVKPGEMTKRKAPLGMRIGESVFCIGYLTFALIAAIYFFLNIGRDVATAPYYTACAWMTLLLAAGDSFHLIPRIILNVKPEIMKKSDFWLGLGNLISSITMTAFYVILHFVVRYDTDYTEGFIGILAALILLAVLRVILCLFPQNRWFDGGNVRWGIIRNIPFVIMGVITVIYLLNCQRVFMALLVTVSFLCYMAVVLFAKKNPKMGMLMIPKTICYIWMIALLL